MVASSVAKSTAKRGAGPVTVPGDGDGGVAAAPVFVVQPQNQTANEGETATFTSLASGNPSPTYQWQVSTDGGTVWNNISGATSANYTTPSLTLTEDGNQYRSVATNSEGSATSDAATLTVNQVIAPAITMQPQNQTVAEGNTATFTVVATGTPAPTYQWQLSTDGGSNYSSISGATSASYTTPATVLADSGNFYRVQVTNVGGSVTSNAAELTVTDGAFDPNTLGPTQYAMDNGTAY